MTNSVLELISITVTHQIQTLHQAWGVEPTESLMISDSPWARSPGPDGYLFPLVSSARVTVLIREDPGDLSGVKRPIYLVSSPARTDSRRPR